MSVGNTKDTGNQGNNFPWQFKMLLGLDKLLSAFVSGGGGPDPVPYLSPKERTSEITRATNSTGIIPGNIYSFSFANVGTSDVTLDGVLIKPGESVTFDAGDLNNTLINTMPYDCTGGGEVLIVTIV